MYSHFFIAPFLIILYGMLHFPCGLARIYTSIFAMNGEENK